MYDPDSSDITISSGGSRLLSLSPAFASDTLSSAHTGLGSDDLSISELSLADRTAILDKPFSLLARTDPPPEPSTPARRDNALNEDAVEEDAEHDATVIDDGRKNPPKKREEKLNSDIFILKKLNASFALFNEALEETGSANERLATQLEHTDQLLSKYVGILAKSEEFARLIFDEEWHGADKDEETLERERIEAIERTRREAEERALAALREQECREREERERAEQEEKERIAREKVERATSRGIRGVRGTRASMRGMRGASASGTTRLAPSTTTRGRPTGSIASQPSGIRRSASSSSTRPSSGESARGLLRRT